MASIPQAIDAATAKVLADAARVAAAAKNLIAAAGGVAPAAAGAQKAVGIVFDSLGFSKGGLYQKIEEGNQPTETIPVDMSTQPIEIGPASEGVTSTGEASS